jgi:hypothetical protein
MNRSRIAAVLAGLALVTAGVIAIALNDDVLPKFGGLLFMGAGITLVTVNTADRTR